MAVGNEMASGCRYGSSSITVGVGIAEAGGWSFPAAELGAPAGGAELCAPDGGAELCASDGGAELCASDGGAELCTGCDAAESVPVGVEAHDVTAIDNTATDDAATEISLIVAADARARSYTNRPPTNSDAWSSGRVVRPDADDQRGLS